MRKLMGHQHDQIPDLSFASDNLHSFDCFGLLKMQLLAFECARCRSCFLSSKSITYPLGIPLQDGKY